MTGFAPVSGLLGGALIGLSAVLLMLGIGRIAGITGIAVAAMVAAAAQARAWRIAFLAGLPVGALLMAALGLVDFTALTFPASTGLTVVAGLVVGFGVTLGSGCTSEHGICGLARLSLRSMAATAMFMATAVATVFVLRHVI
jgi:uncharacterized membrane protein YedE/YeeE